MKSSKMSNEIAEEYVSSLSDLTVNSKPLINMLTMLAEENHDHAPAIVAAVEKHLQKVPSDIKLPVLYLIDSIVKNVGRSYITLFTQNIVSTFCSCFEKVDERTRGQMFKLRQTWNEVFPSKKMYAVDVRVHSVDPAWPVTAPPPTSIHVNPKFFAKPALSVPEPPVVVPLPPLEQDPQAVNEIQMRDQLLRKQKELIELQQRKLTLELMQTKAKLEEQQKQLDRQTGIVHTSQMFQPTLQASNETAAQILAVQKIIEAATLQLPDMNKIATRPKPATTLQPTSVTNAATSTKAQAPSSPKPSARSRDPRLAVRNLQNIVPQNEPVMNTVQLLEPAKSKQPITDNLGCNVPNKEPRGITKPRIITSKVRIASKGSPTNNAGSKAPGTSKTKVASPTTSLPPPMKRIPRLKDSPVKVVKIDLTSTPSPKKGEAVSLVKEGIGSKKLSPKVDSPKKKSSSDKEKSSSRSKVNDSKPVATKPDSPKNKKSDSKSIDNTPPVKHGKGGSKSSERNRERSKYDIDSDLDSPSPPPPPVISDAKKSEERAKFREVKISAKGRNYVRRNTRHESRSRSPVKSDVDLRLNGPPEKQAKLTMTSADIAQIMISEHNVDGMTVDAAKDVDLRQLPGARTGSPNKKRSSAERDLKDQPPSKKRKSEIFDVLFGNEDVDLRRLATAPTSARQPSPPPPPIISQHSPARSSPTPSSPRQESASSPKSSKGKFSDDHVKGNGELKPRDWTKFKGPKSPVSSSPYRDRRGHKIAQGKLDRLGRPLLFHRLPDGRSSDRRRYPSISEDTDMRMCVNEDSLDDVDGNINIIVSQAEEQLKSGQLSFPQYNILIKQVIQLNEAKKLREAQRREENWERRNVRSHRMDLSPVSDDSSVCDRSATFSPCSDISDTTHRVMDTKQHRPSGRVDDIDERYAGPRSMGRGGPNWAWERPPQQWSHGPPRPMQPVLPQQQQRPPFLRPPGGDVRWRQPHPPFINRLQGPSQFEPPPHSIPRFEHFPPGPRPDLFDSRPPPTQQQQQPASFGGHEELPPADAVALDHMAQDTMRTISIDGCPREIRYYGDTAVTMVAWDDPREVMFQRGTRRIVFDDRDSILLALNDAYRDCIIDGEPHKIRFGAPTREIYIDNKWYECYFGGPPITVEVGGKMRTVKLEGPPPQVKLGFAKRTDLCAGKINLIVNAMTMVPVFLDAKPQRVDIENKPHILRFVNALTTVLINGRPFNVEFGGLPKPIMVHNKKHFIRFSVLPFGIRPGYVNIRNMEGGHLPSPSRGDRDNGAQDGSDNTMGQQSSLPPFGDLSTRPPFDRSTSPRNSPNLFENEEVMPMTGVYINHTRIGGQVPLDMLTSLMPSTLAPSSGFGYQVEHESHSQDGTSGTTKPTEEAALAAASEPVTAVNTGLLSFLPPNINVDELFQKLVATGIVPTGQEEGKEAGAVVQVVVDEPKKEEPRIVRQVDLKVPETLRVRQPGLVAILYSGIQCSSCGVRFPPEETMKYSQHLDWHFRQNRRERDNTRKAQSRKWYYDVSDWIQFEEIEDLEHRAQSWFDVQLEATSGVEDAEPVIIPSVSVGENSEDPFCEMCHDKFEQFYNEESEEWHLKLAIRVEDKIYHPLCYEDFKNASLQESVAEVKDDVKDEVKDVEKEVVDEGKAIDAVVEEETLDESNVVVKKEDTERVDMEVAEVEIKIESDGMETSEMTVLPTEDLTNLEDTGETGQSEAELIVNALLDDVFETIGLQLFGPRTVKLEPTDGEMMVTDNTDATITSEVKPVGPAADTTHTAVVSSIDGNVQFEDKPQAGVAQAGSKIKINITKPIVSRESHSELDAELSHSESEPVCGLTPTEQSEDTEPPPPGVETVPESAKLKPKLVGRTLTALPPVTKGSDLTGLCSIM